MTNGIRKHVPQQLETSAREHNQSNEQKKCYSVAKYLFLRDDFGQKVCIIPLTEIVSHIYSTMSVPG